MSEDRGYPSVTNYGLQLGIANASEILDRSFDLVILTGDPVFTGDNYGPSLSLGDRQAISSQGTIVSAYVDLGVAVDYRFYWQQPWTTNGKSSGALTDATPPWLSKFLTDPSGQASTIARPVAYTIEPGTGKTILFGYYVDFWNEAWQQHVIETAVSLVRDKHYDGIFLDDQSVYYTLGDLFRGSFGAQVIYDRARDMAQFIIRVADAIHAMDPNAHLTVNTAIYFPSQVLHNADWSINAEGQTLLQRYMQVVDAHLLENVTELDLRAVLADPGNYFVNETVLVHDSVGTARTPGQYVDFSEAWNLPNVGNSALFITDFNAHTLGNSDYPTTSGDDTFFGGVGPNTINALAGNDTIGGRGGNDVLDGGAGVDTAVFGSTYANSNIRLDGATLVISAPGEGTDRLTGFEKLAFADREVSLAKFLGAVSDPAAYKLFAGSGFAGSAGRSGQIVGALGKQDITIRDDPGFITLDPSFNAGGDVVRFGKVAASYTASVSGSSAVFSDGDTRVTIPIGEAGLEVAFADGSRTLRYDGTAQVVRIGGQALSANASTITAASEHAPSPISTASAPAARVFIADGHADLTGKIAVFGSSGEETLALSNGTFVLDPSFNKGGDRIMLDQVAADYSVALSGGSSVIVRSLSETLTIPVGEPGLTLSFTDTSLILRYDAQRAVIMVGDFEVHQVPTLLGPLAGGAFPALADSGLTIG